MNTIETNEVVTEFYTKTPSVLIFQLRDEPITFLILQYLILRRGTKQKWAFHITDIANYLNKNTKTIRKYLKPLLALNLITLEGNAGHQYYEFNTEMYDQLLQLNPFDIQPATPPTAWYPSHSMGPDPSHGMVGVPLPRYGRLDMKEEDMKDLDMKEPGASAPGAGISKESPSPSGDEIPNPQPASESLPSNNSVETVQVGDEVGKSKLTPEIKSKANPLPQPDLHSHGTDLKDNHGLSIPNGIPRPELSSRPVLVDDLLEQMKLVPFTKESSEEINYESLKKYPKYSTDYFREMARLQNSCL